MFAVVTGIGLVTALGSSVDQTWQSLLAGRFITTHARVEATNLEDHSRVVSLAIQAVDPAVKMARWNDDRSDIAVIGCTSKGSVEQWMDSAPLPISGGFGLSDLSASIARRIGSTWGPRLTFSAACAGGLHALIRGVTMIQTGEARRVLIVAAEASVHPLFLNSFQRLGVFPAAGELCRPFDENRSGFLMSDAAAAICLEASADFTGRLHIDRFAMGGDATHLTGSDPAATVLRKLLRRAIGDDPIELFHAHGTGTVTNDRAELAALNSVLSEGNVPNVFSHKAALGHSLGASGLVSVVINCMCHRKGVIPPNINTSMPIAPGQVGLERGAVQRTIRRSLVHAAGFGGPTAVVGLTGW